MPPRSLKSSNCPVAGNLSFTHYAEVAALRADEADLLDWREETIATEKVGAYSVIQNPEDAYSGEALAEQRTQSGVVV